LLNVKKQGQGIMVAVLFILGIVGIIGLNTNTTYASGETVGVVNYQLLVTQHPDTATAEKTMEIAVAQTKSDFDTKSASMNDADKQALYQQLQQGLNQKKMELMGPINDKIMSAVKSVASSKGLTVVVDKNSIVYGGQDITDDVVQVITKK